MRTITTLLALGTMAWGSNGVAADACPQALDFGKRRLAGDEVVNLCDAYKGKVVLVEFPMFEKVSVKKGDADPLFEYLAAQAGAYPKWNFYKYLIDRDGQVVDYFTSVTSPESGKVVSAIERLL